MNSQKKKAAKNNKLLIVGLGNPGEQYSGTRHNAGFAVIDYLIETKNIKVKKAFLKPVIYGTIEHNGCILTAAKPLTYMNRSGNVINFLLRKTGTGVDDLIIVCDNMDLNPGIIRLKAGGSSAGHNGIKSVIASLGRSDFKRLYIGVGKAENREKVVEHVLGKFEAEEAKNYNESLVSAAGALLSLTETPLNLVMNEINKRNN